MPDYKLLGNQNPVTDELGVMTQGIGFPLIPVDKYIPDAAGTGDVTGPNTSTNNAITRFNGTTGKEIKNSTATLSDTGVLNCGGVLSNGQAAYASVANMGTNPEAFATKNYVDVGDNITVTNTQDRLLYAFSAVTQEPTALSTNLQIIFGAAQAGPVVSLAANGAITFLVAGDYDIRLRLQFGRSGASGIAELFGRALLNGLPLGQIVHTKLNAAEFSIPCTFEFIVTATVGSVLTFQIRRGSGGTNAGGIFTATDAVWGTSPSAVISISRTKAVIT